jgi:hypothetical protein
MQLDNIQKHHPRYRVNLVMRMVQQGHSLQQGRPLKERNYIDPEGDLQ